MRKNKGLLTLGLGDNCPPIPSICTSKNFSFIKEARFFQKEDLRGSRPSVEMYKNREFVSKFFQETVKKCI